MNTQENTSQYRAIALLAIRLFLMLSCQVAQSDWWQDWLSSHLANTNSENIEHDVEQGSCDIPKLDNK
jgi:hypothetical protein